MLGQGQGQSQGEGLFTVQKPSANTTLAPQIVVQVLGNAQLSVRREEQNPSAMHLRVRACVCVDVLV